MARARNIKPAIMANEDLAELQPMERLLFIYLWMLADREGRLEDRPKRIKAEAFPYDDTDVDEMLDSLQSAGFIARYLVDGKRFIQVHNFTKHQRPHNNETSSEIPPMDQGLRTPKEPEIEHVQRASNHGEHGFQPREEALRSDLLIPDSLIPEEEHVDAHASTQGELIRFEPEHTAQLLELDRTPYERIRELYNTILGGKLKRCMGLNDTHRKHIRAAYNLKLDGKFIVRDGGLEFWEGLFHDVLDCPFMLGKNNRGWRADFEFLTTSTKIQKFLEGKYDNVA